MERKFTRYSTDKLGFLGSGYLDTPYSVVETRILFEIWTNKRCIQSDIVKTLHIDKSYLSRIIKGFCKMGLVEKRKSDEDKRAAYIMLTKKGVTETERLIALTNQQIRAKIRDLNADECGELCAALDTVIFILGRSEGHESDSV